MKNKITDKMRYLEVAGCDWSYLYIAKDRNFSSKISTHRKNSFFCAQKILKRFCRFPNKSRRTRGNISVFDYIINNTGISLKLLFLGKRQFWKNRCEIPVPKISFSPQGIFDIKNNGGLI